MSLSRAGHQRRYSDVDHRRRELIDRLREAPQALADLQDGLGVSRNTLGADLAWLRRHFAHHLDETRGPDGCKRLSWRGDPPTPVPVPPEWLTEDELLALITARGLLRDPRGGAAETRQTSYRGLLDGAIDALLHRLGLQQEVADIAPETIQVSRFAAHHEDPASLDEVLRALLRQRHLRFQYRNVDNAEHPVHAAPQRLVNIAGEWHLIAWAPHAEDPTGGRLKQYRVSRMTCVASCREAPERLPVHFSQRTVDERLDEAFRATGSADPADRRRVVLAVSPQGLPHLEGRTWGGDQRWDPVGDFPPLPTGWRRLAFSTTGLAECRHWVLSLGTTVRAERPAELVAWLQAEAAGILAAFDNQGLAEPDQARPSKTPGGVPNADWASGA